MLYWDSDVFLSYVNAVSGRIRTLEDLLQEIQENDDDIIVTSAIAKVEVAFAIYEKTQALLDPQVEADLDALWQDASVVELVEFNDDIATMARSLIRESISRQWQLKPPDAIHLASAQWLGGVQEFHTYDIGLHKYKELIGCDVCEPYVAQPRLHA